MFEEKFNGINSLPDGVDEIITQLQNDQSVTNALTHDKKFFDDFTSLLTDLNKIVTERKETNQRNVQISMF